MNRFSFLAPRLTSIGSLALVLFLLDAPTSAAQDAEGFEGAGFAIDVDPATGEEFGYSVPVSPPETRRVPRDKDLARLAARGIELPVREPTPGRPISRKMTEAERRQDSLGRVLAHSDASDPDHVIDLIVKLNEAGLEDMSSYQGLEGDARKAAMESRRYEIREAQQAYLSHALDYAEVASQGHVSNALHIRVPAHSVRAVINHPDVVSVHPGWYKVLPDYDGRQVRDATFIQNLVDDGFTGESGGRYSSGSDNIKIAILEAADDFLTGNFLNTAHPGWDDWSGGPSRVQTTWDCLGGCGPAAANSFATHGTIVTWVATGSIQQGQDPNHTSSAARNSRSGVAREAEIYYFRVRNAADVFNALGWATFAGADVANMSMRIADCQNFCNRNLDCAGINGQLEAVTDAGMLVVKSTSNLNAGGTQYPVDVDCNVTYPGWRPEVVSVGNINTTGSTAYDSAAIADSSSRGLVNLGVGGSWSTVFTNGLDVPAVSIAAPGVVSLHFAENDEYQDTSSHPVYSDEVSGTSFSSPVVAGAAGLLRETMIFYTTNARMLKTLVLLMGDGRDAWKNGWTESGVSDTWGTGRLKVHRLSALPAPACSILYTGHVFEGSETWRVLPCSGGVLPSGVKQLKWVAYIDQPDLDEMPYIYAEIQDTCNNNAVVGSDYFFGPVKYVSVSAGAVSAGRCLRMRLYGLSVPAGGIRVYNAVYYSSGDPDDH